MRDVSRINAKERSLLLAEVAALGQLALSTGGHAQHGAALAADNGSLSVAEDGGDAVAAAAAHIHEVRVGALYQALELVHLLLGARVGHGHVGHRHG